MLAEISYTLPNHWPEVMCHYLVLLCKFDLCTFAINDLCNLWSLEITEIP